MKKTIFWILLLFLNIIINESFAQSNKILTDRPGQTMVPFTIPKKWIQSEIGFSFENFQQSGNDRMQFYELPQVLLKYGLFNNFEIRTMTTLGSTIGKYNNNKFSFTGISDLQLGFKFKFLDQKKILPHTALIVHYMFNSLNGIRANRRDTLNGLQARLAMQHSISETFTINYNVGVEWPAFIRKHSYLYSLSPRFYFLDKWMIYAEVFGNIWDYKSPQHNYGAGVSCLLNNNIKIDAGYSRWKKEYYPSSQISIGATIRLNTRNNN